MMNQLTLEQIELSIERDAVEMGQTRYNGEKPVPWRDVEHHRNEEADLRPGRELVFRSLLPLVEGINELIERTTEGKASRGRPSVVVKYLAHFEPTAVAYMTARKIINTIAAGRTESLTKTCVGLACMLDDHYRTEQLAEADKKQWNFLSEKLEKMSNEQHRRKVLLEAIRRNDVKGLEWLDEDKLRVGRTLITMFVERTGLAEIRVDKVGKKTIERLAPNEKTVEWLAKAHAREALLSPVCLPMVVPPVDWTNPRDGGYLDHSRMPHDLIKTFRKDTVDELFSIDMPELYSAVNAIQRTAWAVNKGLTNVVREAWDRQLTLKGALPRPKSLSVPPRPHGIPENVPLSELTPDQQKVLKRWKADAAKVHEANADAAEAAIRARQQLWVAERFSAYEQIYFVWQLDFRGRAYPTPQGMNPQADDLGKALLEFGTSKPMGSSGGYWLAVHIANCWGYDKHSFDERVKWTQEHEQQILDSAMSPLDGEMFWLEADKKSRWQALAAAMEWARFAASGYSEDFMTSLPIAMDGSCSGLQHYSAALLDERGAAAVNVLPAVGKKADIYSDVGAVVKLRLDTSTDAIATYLKEMWTDKLARKLCKQPTMTFSYGVTFRGARDQIVSAAEENGLGSATVRPFEIGNYLAPLVLDAIRDTVKSAALGMKWLQECAKVAGKRNCAVHWVTPVGLVVVQDSRKGVAKQVEVYINGRRHQPVLMKDTDKIDARKQSEKIAPNFIHSMDAAHMMKTVNLCVANGLDSFAMVHDSFGTHAGDVDMLHACIREAFILIYGQTSWIERFREGLKRQLPEDAHDDIPPLPAMGNLDLNRVRDSEFFFA